MINECKLVCNSRVTIFIFEFDEFMETVMKL